MAPRHVVFVGPLGGGVRVTRRRRLSMMTVSALTRIVVEFIPECAGPTVNGEYQAFIECAAAMMPQPTSGLRLRVGIRVRLLDVRHSYAAAALRTGVPPKVISERLGRAGVAFTLQV